VRDPSWLAAELQAWAAALGDVAAVEIRPGDDDLRVRMAARRERALPVEALVREDAIEIALGEWRRSFPADDEGTSEAAELVATALFGHARVEMDVVGEDWTRYEVQFRVRDRWVAFDATKRGRFAFWKRATIVHLANDLAPPPDLELGACGRLPTAPWIGLLPGLAAEPVARELAVDGEIDLHPFSPKEVAQVVRAYIDACLERGVYELRVVHGKGIGNLRRTVHALLSEHPAVVSYRLGGHGEGGWGATMVSLERPQV
jgi:hypothetical protein